MTKGSYCEHGLRYSAMQFAVDCNEKGMSAEQIVEDAEKFYAFMTRGSAQVEILKKDKPNE